MIIHHQLPSFGRLPADPINGPRSGIVQAALALARHSGARGHQVRVVGWSEGPPSRFVSPEGVAIRSHPGWKFGRIARWDVRWLAPMAIRSFRDPTPDILHVHADPNLLRLCGKGRFLHLHTPVEPTLSTVYLRLLDRADGVLCCSDYIRNSFLSVTGWDPERTATLRNGTNTDQFQPAEAAERAALRIRFGLAPTAFVVVYVGAIAPEKGVLHLIRAYKALKDRIPEAVLLVVGSANLWGGHAADNSDLRAYEAELMAEVTEGIHMLGAMPHRDIPDLFKASDVLAVPSVWDDPAPLVPLDGMAAGLAVIASRVGGIPEYITDGIQGILTPPKDEHALAYGLCRLAEDEALRTRFGRAGRERALQLSWPGRVAELELIYDRIITRRRAFPSTKSGDVR